MKTNIRTVLPYAGLALAIIVPSLAFAQGVPGDTIDQLLHFEDQSKFLEAISLWSTLIIALSTTVMVWLGGRKMHGGIFGSVLNYFSIGMALVFVAFLLQSPWFTGFDQFYLKLIYDSLFILGFITMGLAASKLNRAING